MKSQKYKAVCKLFIFEKLAPILFVFNVCLNQISQPILKSVNKKISLATDIKIRDAVTKLLKEIKRIGAGSLKSNFEPS